MIHNLWSRYSWACGVSPRSGFVPVNVRAVAKPFHICNLGSCALVAAGLALSIKKETAINDSMDSATDGRIDTDALGDRVIPATSLYGANTVRGDGEFSVQRARFGEVETREN